MCVCVSKAAFKTWKVACGANASAKVCVCVRVCVCKAMRVQCTVCHIPKPSTCQTAISNVCTSATNCIAKSDEFS